MSKINSGIERTARDGTPRAPTPRNRVDHGAMVAREHGIARSPLWPGVEHEHLAREPRCRCCSAHAPPAPVQVHHIFPFHICVALGRPDLELDQRNLITLCEREHDQPAEDHHLLVGHLGDFRSSNLEVARDARERFHGLTADAIRRAPQWVYEVSVRIKPLTEMTGVEKHHLVQLMNTRLPKR